MPRKRPNTILHEQINAMQVQDGDIILVECYRVKVSAVRVDRDPAGGPVARYRLNSAPNEDHPSRLPRGYEGMSSGGNHLRMITLVERS